MKLELTDQEFRYLLDLVYIGNWVLNSTRGDDRIEEYDQVEGKVFSHCVPQGMPKLVERYRGSLIPSRAFAASTRPSSSMRIRSSTSCWRRSWPCGIWTVSP